MRRFQPAGLFLLLAALAISARSEITNAAPGSETGETVGKNTGEARSQVTPTTVEVVGCCYAKTRHPRQCVCVTTEECKLAVPARKSDCKVCLVGPGTYATMEECVAAGDIGAEKNFDTAPFPEPTVAATTCIANAATTADSRTECPHLQPGLAAWEDPATWGGSVPNGVENITLPVNTKVLLTACSLPPGTEIKQIIVPFGSELILDDTDMAITLGSIIVRGALRAGSPTCRLNSHITLTFKAYPEIEPISMGITTTTSGTLDLHGKLYTPTWTRLAATASAGATTISLQAEVNWRPGQLIAVITSTFKDEVNNQNEVRTIKAVGDGGKTVTFDTPLSFQHYGGSEYQSEVALLSRNIKIMGSAETENTRKGPHVRMQAASRISGVMAYRAGQFNILGAYPFHFHMIGDGTGASLTDNSVYHSYFRCYTIHGTDNSVVKNNVGFDVNGHCFYVEDGVEENNTIEGNFAGYIHPIGIAAGGADQEGIIFESSKDLIQPADAGAAGFYISNPNNNVIGNAASGGVSGFTIPVLPKPTGLSRNVQIVPSARPWGTFKGNSAHSSGYYSLLTGGCFYFGGKLIEEPVSNYEFKFIYDNGRFEFPTKDKDGVSETTTPLVEDGKAWLCNAGLLHWGQKVNIDGWETHDSIRSVFLLSRSVVSRLYATGYTGNTIAAHFPGNRADFVPQAAFQLYDTGTMTIITNSKFQNWKYNSSLGELRPAIFYSMTHSDQYKPQAMCTMSNISYVDVDYDAIARLDVKETGSSRFFNWIDADGTSVQLTGPYIVGAYPRWWEISSDCFFQDAWQLWVCPSESDQTVARIDLRIPGYTLATENAVPPSADNYIGTISQFGERRDMTITKNEGIVGVTGPTGWFPSFDKGAAKTMELWMTQVPIGKFIIFAAKYPKGTTFDIQRVFKFYGDLSGPLTQVESLDAVLSANGTKYFFDDTYLYVKLVDPQLQGGNLVQDGLTVYGIRWWDMYYSINATNLVSNFTELSGCTTCPPPAVVMPAFVADVEEVGQPSALVAACTDVAPSGGGSAACAALYAEGECMSPYALATNACALTCGRCDGIINSPLRSTSAPKKGKEGAEPSTRREYVMIPV